MTEKNFIADIEIFAKTNPDRLAMLGEEGSSWKRMTWGEIWPKINSTALAIIKEGVESQENIAIYAQNSPEWTITDIACQLSNTVAIPLHSVGNIKDTIYILEHSSPSLIFAGGEKEYKSILDINPASVKTIVVFDSSVQLSDKIHSVHYTDFISLKQTKALTSILDERKWGRKKDDLFTIVYTSGTTGKPKGVMLTHANFDFQVEALEKPTAEQKLLPGEASLSFLPLSHIYERQWNRIVLYYGYANAYLAKPARIMEAASALKPATLCSVPRIFEKIHCAVENKISSSPRITAGLIKHSVRFGIRYNVALKNNGRISPLKKLHLKTIDWLVLRHLRGILGGKVKYAPCGGAPLSAGMQKFFCGLGITIRSGYGLTETCGSVSSQDPDDYTFGSTGKPMKGVKVRISEEGELQLKGGNIMKGYYKDPEATREAFTHDGYLKTGDIAEIEANGEIRITDRIKDMMKTSGGKYIAPQPIEGLFTDDIYIEKIALIADQREFVSALIEPNKAALIEYAKNHGIHFENYESLLAKKEIYNLFKNRISAKTAELARHEMIRGFALIAEPFSIEKGELTPSLKLKRKVIAERYHELIESIYANCRERKMQRDLA